MRNRADGTTPLWITELAWGSAPPDSFGINKGPAGQAQMLTSSYRMILNNRKAWNVRAPLLVPLARSGSPTGRARAASAAARGCCGTTAPAEARLRRVQGLHGRDRPAPGEHHRGAGAREAPPRTRPRPSPLPRTSPARPSSAGSTEGPSGPAARRTRPRRSRTAATPSSSGRSTPPETRARSCTRSFTVDTQPSAGAAITDTDPNSPANDNAPEVKGTAAAGTTVRLYKTAGCTGTPVGVRSAANFASPGHHRLGPRQHDHGLPRQGDGRRGQPLGVLGRPLLRRGLDAVEHRGRRTSDSVPVPFATWGAGCRSQAWRAG